MVNTSISEQEAGSNPEGESLPQDVREELVDPVTNEVFVADAGVAAVPSDMHVGDTDSDEEISAKLRRQGVRLDD